MQDEWRYHIQQLETLGSEFPFLFDHDKTLLSQQQPPD